MEDKKRTKGKFNKLKFKSLKKKQKSDNDQGTKVVPIVNNGDKTFDEKGKGKKNKKGKKTGWKIFRICLFVFIALCIIGAGVVVGVISGIVGKTDSLALSDIELQNETSFIYDKDSNQIGAFFDSENRVMVNYEDLPKPVVDAIVSIEDERFFSHNGIDIKRTLGAIVTYVINRGDSNFGGSTITQQLVKNIKDDKESSWQRKIREWYRALMIEKMMSKEKIFEAYVNTIYFGDGAYGIEVASENYFGKSVKDLNVAEAAIIAAKIQSPESTNPYKSEEAKKKLLDRQKIVLNQMLKLKKIDQQQYDEALKYEVAFKKEEVQADSSVQTYFVDAIYEQVLDDLMEAKGINKGLATKMLLTGGLKIYTTQDSSVQKAIDDAYNDSKTFANDFQGAMVVIENSTGNVVGLTGGAGEKTGARVLNRALVKRQPGSTMKPFGAYGPAMEQGLLSPGSGLDDSPLTIGNWSPKNYYNGFNGYVTVRNAINKSMNLPAVRANRLVDINYAFNFAKNAGLKSLVEADKNSASLALGGLTDGVTPLELASAYATIANGGIYIEPKLYTKVVDNDGNEVLSTKTEAKRVMADSTAYMLTSCLQSVISSANGTAYGYIKTPGIDVAGKTGNTNDDKDRWFAGFTPYYSIAGWEGYDKPKVIGKPYPYVSITKFNSVMSTIVKGLPNKKFEQPSSVTTAALCRISGKVATDACRNDPRGDQTLTDLVAVGKVPTATCDIHKTVRICTESGKIATQYCPSTVEKSFITRDSVPTVKPADWQYMLPTETCDIHTSKPSTEKPDDGNNGGVDIYNNNKTQ